MSIIIALLASFALTVVFLLIFIPLFKRYNVRQMIREVGPTWHQKKTGTPTMGGICFIAATVIVMLYLYRGEHIDGLMMVGVSVLMGGIGFIDDYFKVINKRNLGLKAWQKFTLQLVTSIAFVTVGRMTGVLSTVIEIPFIGRNVDLGLFYVPFAIFVMLSTSNGGNLTDGIDGLCSSVTAIICMFFLACSSVYGSSGIFPAALIGGLIAFLIFNMYPARVFMGDTGSLFLGAAVGAMGLVLANPLSILMIAVVYFAEALSVIIQVVYFKYTKKRFFKMAPIHHHFEMCGYSEMRIVITAMGVTVVMCALALFASGII